MLDKKKKCYDSHGKSQGSTYGDYARKKSKDYKEEDAYTPTERNNIYTQTTRMRPPSPKLMFPTTVRCS